MNISKKIHPPYITSKNFSTCPLTEKTIYKTVDKTVLTPTQGSNYLFIIKQIIKKLLGKKLTPELFYNPEIDFAFFERPDEDEINKFYLKQGEDDGKDLNAREKFALSKSMQLSSNIMLDFCDLSLHEKLRCVDFGAGSGWFAVNLALYGGKKIQAVDYSIEAMEHIKKLNGDIELLSNKNFFKSNSKYDFLVSVDLFEHVAEPLSLLKDLYQKADDQASIFISVPNFNSFFSRHHLGCHPYYSYPEHLNYFTKTSLEYLVQKSGFIVDKVCSAIRYRMAFSR
jgi:2-polyprenyl-3-methyl-5-hydroxy-6-metoxy-1,4-benzoquinol methylase